MIVPGLNDLSYKLVRVLLKGNGEMYYPYSYLESETGYSRIELKKTIDIFKKMGIIEYARGLMTDDGMVAGSGFGIPYGEKYNTAELAVYRHIHGYLDETVDVKLPDKITIDGEIFVKEKHD